MKYRTIQVVSLFAAFPVLTFAGSGLDLPGPLSALQARLFETVFIDNDVSLINNLSIPKASKEEPTLVQTQTAKLPEQFTGISATVSRFSNGQQALSFEASETPRQSSHHPYQPTSDYYQLLLKMIEMVVHNGVNIWFDEKSSSFNLSFASFEPGYQSMVVSSIQVPSRVISEHNPEGVLSGFTALGKTSLTDTVNALNCYHNHVGAYRPDIVACGNGAYLSANGSKNSYNYFLTAAAPSSVRLFSKLIDEPLGNDNGWFLSDELLLVTYQGKPVKIASIGDMPTTEAPSDAGGNTAGSDEKSASKINTQKKEKQSGSKTVRTSFKKKPSASGHGGDDPDENRPVDYGKKPPNDATSTQSEPESSEVRKLRDKLNANAAKVASLEEQINIKWRRNRRRLESGNHNQKMKELKELKQEGSELLQQLEQARRKSVKKEKLPDLPRAKNKKSRMTTNQLLKQINDDRYMQEETDDEIKQRQYEEYKESLESFKASSDDDQSENQTDSDEQDDAVESAHISEEPEQQEAIGQIQTAERTDTKKLKLGDNHEFPDLGQ